MDTQITQLLAKVAEGDKQAFNDLVELLYPEMRAMAHRLRDQRAGNMMSTTVLVHEAYLRLLGPDGRGAPFANKKYFFGAAGEAMRRVRVDDARKRGSLKRGGDRRAMPLEDRQAPDGPDPDMILDLHEALDRLEGLSTRQAEVVKLLFFLEMSIDEVAQALEISPRTVDNDWKLARAWLHRELSGGDTA